MLPSRRLLPATRIALGVATLTTLTATLTAGCDTVDSADVRTSGVDAYVTVSTSSAGSEVTVSLSAGGLTSVELADGERLIASAGDEEVTLDHESFLGSHTYVGELGGVTEPGATITVTWERGPDDDDAVSTVDVAAPIDVVSPREGATARRSADLLFDVEGRTGDVEVSWEGSCVEGETNGALTVPETDAVVVPADEVRYNGIAKRRTCLVTFRLAHLVRGDLADEFEGGSIVARRVDSVTLRSRP